MFTKYFSAIMTLFLNVSKSKSGELIVMEILRYVGSYFVDQKKVWNDFKYTIFNKNILLIIIC